MAKPSGPQGLLRIATRLPELLISPGLFMNFVGWDKQS